MPNNKIFQYINAKPPRHSAFDLSRNVKTTFNMGELVPIFVEEVLPTDDYRVESIHQIRFAPMLYPLMHHVDVYVHYFFVPNRITWINWEEFITGGQDGTLTPAFPVVDLATIDNSDSRVRLMDRLGLPVNAVGDAGASTVQVSQLPFRAYMQIYNDYYRDPNLTAELDITDFNNWFMYFRAWEKDYFTSALPWTQRGTAMGVPVDIGYLSQSLVKDDIGGSLGNLQVDASEFLKSSGLSPSLLDARIENLDTTQINFDIIELRLSSAVQRWLELSARGGARYVEQLESFFGQEKQDARLNRAEYLGGGKQPVQISEVLSTNDSTSVTLGQFGGHGISVGNSNEFRYKVPEHGYIIGIMSVLPRTSYFQGIPRHWSRTSKFDYYFPQFANLGEQEVVNQELYFDPADDAYNVSTFGYQQRYAEYKYGISTVHGAFRDGLLPFHLGRNFTTQPTLSTAFVRSDPSDRIFNIASTADDTLWCQIQHRVLARRPMPFFSNPSLQ